MVLTQKTNMGIQVSRICGHMDRYSDCLVFGPLVLRFPVSTIPSRIQDRYKERLDASVLNNAGASGKQARNCIGMRFHNRISWLLASLPVTFMFFWR